MGLKYKNIQLELNLRQFTMVCKTYPPTDATQHVILGCIYSGPACSNECFDEWFISVLLI